MASSSCPVSTDFEPLTFDPPPFENTRSISFMHNSPPRFGYPSDISMLIDGSKEEGRDYINGLIASSIAIFLFFCLWLLLLLGFKCVGPWGVGWLSGRGIPMQAKPQVEDHEGAEDFSEELEQWHQLYNKKSRRLNFLRALVLFAGLSIVVSSILLSVKGANGLLVALDDGVGTISIVKNLLYGGIGLIDGILETSTTTTQDIDTILIDINSICPAIRNPICTNITDPSTCDTTGIVDGDVITAFVEFFATTKSLVYEDLIQSRQDLQDFVVVAEKLEDYGDAFNWAFWCSMAFSLALALVCLSFMAGAIFELPRTVKCLQNVILVPLFVLLVVLSWVFSMVFVIGSMSLADICHDDGTKSVDDRMLALVEKLESNFSPLIFAFIVFYVSGCPFAIFPTGVLDFFRVMVRAVATLDNAAGGLDGSLSNVFCDRGKTGTVVLLTNAASASVCQIASLFLDLRDYLKCDAWFPLYENSVYQAMCYSGTDAFAWVTATQFVIVFMSMFILTFRIVFYDIDVAEPTPKEDQAPKVEVTDNNNIEYDKDDNNGNEESKNGDDTDTEKAPDEPKPDQEQPQESAVESQKTPAMDESDGEIVIEEIVEEYEEEVVDDKGPISASLAESDEPRP